MWTFKVFYARFEVHVKTIREISEPNRETRPILHAYGLFREPMVNLIRTCFNFFLMNY